MNRLRDCSDKLADFLGKCLLAIVTSEGLYLCFAFLFAGVLNSDVFLTRSNLINPVADYVMRPWAGAMLALYVARDHRAGGWDTRLLALLLLWIVVPFVMRFGTEFFTIQAALNYAVCFFGIYAMARTSDAQRRVRQLDMACAGFCLISLLLGGALLYCAATGNGYYSYTDTVYFGIVNGQLQSGTHYNTTGMIALCCVMMCLTGFARSKNKLIALPYLLAALMMMLVVVLTQSRTARYSMLLALCAGTWSVLGDRLPISKTLIRHGVALLCGAAVLAGGYAACARITDAALAHYANPQQMHTLAQAIVPSASAEEYAPHSEEAPAVQQASEARAAVDATFSDRTNIWKNVIRHWADEPWYLLIGNGVGRTKWMVTMGTIHESLGFASVHNAYLQYTAELGLIAFALLAAVFAVILRPVLRVFFARGEKRMPGGCALCMMVIAALATGMMESAPLEAMTPINMVLFFALGHLAAAGMDMKKAK